MPPANWYAINSNMLQTLRLQFAKGYVGRLDVATQEVSARASRRHAAAAAQATGPTTRPVGGSFRQFPQPGPRRALRPWPALQLPQELPVSLPSQLVAQRPDVRQAEESLHAASAQVGIAVANRLPNITLTADAGTMALEAGRMFSDGVGFWTLAGGLTQPIFEGGALLHQERAAKAAFTQAAEQYRATVLAAFQDVADTLNALQQDADGLNAAATARDAAKVTLDLARKQFQVRLRRLPLASDRRTDLPTSLDEPRSGPGQSLR